MERFTPIKRRALDGRLWWCIYDNERHAWSTYTAHGKYKTRKAARDRVELAAAYGVPVSAVVWIGDNKYIVVKDGETIRI